MNGNFTECPDRSTLENYFFEELDGENSRLLEEHYFSCDKCIEEARRISMAVSKLRIIKAGRTINESWERYGDRLEEFKCASSEMESVRVFNTRNNKFKVTLRPVDGNTREVLLEIEVLDDSINGSLLLFIDGHKEEMAIDSSRIVCLLINRDADIGNLIIRYNQ